MRTLKANPKFLWLFGAGLLCTLCHTAKATIEPPPVTKPAGHVLIYTDNSPGSILAAFSMDHVVRRNGYATRVTLDEADFITRLPERSWEWVIVATRFTSTAPGYSAALKRYVRAGGTAQITLWKDDEKQPHTEGVVSGPTAAHVWAHGFTARDYAVCTYDRDKLDAPIPGYKLCDFGDVKLQKIVKIDDPGYSPLSAGEYPPLKDTAATTTNPNLQRYLNRLNKDWSFALEARGYCEDFHGPHPEVDPPTEGDPEELAQCIAKYNATYVHSIGGDLFSYDLRIRADLVRKKREEARQKREQEKKQPKPETSPASE